MNQTDVASDIRGALATLPGREFPAAATDLLGVIGYRSDLVPDSQPATVDDFIQQYPAPTPDTKTERALREAVESIRVLFQFTDQEITTQGSLFNVASFDTGISRSFLFTAVELKDTSYPRGDYATFAREINKRWQIPTVVLFRTTGDLLTLAFVHRRPNRRDPERDVLGSVSLIREIRPSAPHRAHLDILAELSLTKRLRWMDVHGQSRNFDDLLAAWLDALDTEELNRRFYWELLRWFDRAVQPEFTRFPTAENKVLSPQEHIIRLITRMLFIWFIKEKGLVAPELFVEHQVAPLLKDYDRATGDSYYRTVLQNLFFATLNTEIDRRGFSEVSNPTYRDFTRYRYKSEMAGPNALVAYFDRTPFINGGLFDCLDSEEAKGKGGYRIDCFSDVDKGLLSIPNRLFFGPDGLIDLFERYKFTVEENTPVEVEVALDPELLGKVFENLLAAYNPETRESARKQTGSYYTPRPVVDYMVDEALVASIVQKVGPDDADRTWWEERLHYLLDYNEGEDAAEFFEDIEAERIIRAIADLRVLDPAVGSGAFPMGVLHKLTLALRRLDPRNKLWENLQKELAGGRAAAAFGTLEQQDREERLKDISDTFERYRDSDFGRKLYLIQNTIYGVDIQPVATQIAKLRFFISLAIEQQPDAEADNFGIHPLPNLETRFVAANTLLGLASQIQLGQTPEVEAIQQGLRDNRERHFHAGRRAEKLRLTGENKRLRNDLASALKAAGWPARDADNLSAWEPFDQNASANWFDAKYMFGVEDGFDVVIGNPPYRQVPKGTHSELQFPYAEGRDKGKQNLYKLFVEQSYNLSRDGGVSTLIVQSSLMCDLSASGTRRLLLDNTELRHVIELPEKARSAEAQVFAAVTQGTCIFQYRKQRPAYQLIAISIGNDTETINAPTFAYVRGSTIRSLWPHLLPLPRIQKGSLSILENVSSSNSIQPLYNFVVGIKQGDLNLTTQKANFSTKKSGVQMLRGRNVSRFVVHYDGGTEWCTPGFMESQVQANQDNTFLVSQEVMNQQADRRLNFALTPKTGKKVLWGHSVNKTLLKDQGLSKAFLGILNSKFLDWFFRITSSNTHVQGYELEQLPVPYLSKVDCEALTDLVDSILTAKDADPAASTQALGEAEVDRVVYRLYGLTEEDIAVVEGKLG